MDDLVQRMVHQSSQDLSPAEQPETWVEVDEDAKWEIRAADAFTAAAGRLSRAGRSWAVCAG